ncbi:MAG: zinc-dependent alcohol dehydrogenase family protein [Deltaproteobacteria bacterium]|nr:zinc-dependent alcohol dehydrogenase family protein [Deltaproteobacteria bacterium]
MQVMALHSPKPVSENPLVPEEVDLPEPGPGEIRVKVSVCGICHTDLHTVEGDLPLPRLPLVPGHQVVGVVEKSGKGAKRFAEGDRVGLAWLHSACGACSFCSTGRENLCESGRFTGYHTDGGYAEYTVIHEDFAYRLPERFPDEAAAPLLCAGIIGYRALRLSGIKPGERLGLYGFGASAHVTIQVARHRGCEVYVFSRGEKHLKLAEKLGACWTGRAEETPPHLLDASIIFAPAGGILPEALRVLEKGGTLALAGITMSDIPSLDYTKHLYFEKMVRSVANSTRQDGEELLKIAGEIPIETETTLFPLREANRALQQLKEGKINGAGVLKILPD